MEPWRLLYPLRTFLIISGTVEKPNVMVADWLTPLSFNPFLLGVAISPKRYTHKLITSLKELVVAVPTEELLPQVWKAGTLSGASVNKKELLKLTFVPSKKVKVPSIKECAANLECKVKNVIATGDHDFFICEVLDFSYAKEFYDSLPKPEVRFLLHVGKNYFTTPNKRWLSV